MQVFPLSEGTFTIGYDKLFIPFDLEYDKLETRSRGSLLVEIQPFLVDTGNDLIIFDSGLGFHNDQGDLQIHHNLYLLGYHPDDVTKVLLSHLHKDHSGGLVYTNHEGIDTVTFPNAKYYIYKEEMLAALSNQTNSYDKSQVEKINRLSNIQWLEGGVGMIDGFIEFRHSGGHCAQHIVYLVHNGYDKVFFGGDEAPQFKQLKTKYIAKYDYDGRRAMHLREQYVEEGRKDDWTFLFYHDIKKPISSIDF